MVHSIAKEWGFEGLLFLVWIWIACAESRLSPSEVANLMPMHSSEVANLMPMHSVKHSHMELGQF